MLSQFQNSDELLQKSKSEGLYEALVTQLNKDFARANIEFHLSSEIAPMALKKLLHEKLYVLLLERFTDYLNLMYVIDIPEKTFKNLELADAVELAEKVCFLVLAREWQKVWYRNQDKTS